MAEGSQHGPQLPPPSAKSFNACRFLSHFVTIQLCMLATFLYEFIRDKARSGRVGIYGQNDSLPMPP